MKKITVFICAAALACSMSFPAFAAQTKKEYNTETAQVRQELADTSASIKNLQKSSRTASDAAKTVRQGWKDSGQLKEHKDTWNQVRELKDNITEVQVSYTEASGQARLLKAQEKNDVKDGKYDEAIAKLNHCLEQTVAQLSIAPHRSAAVHQKKKLCLVFSGTFHDKLQSSALITRFFNRFFHIQLGLRRICRTESSRKSL